MRYVANLDRWSQDILIPGRYHDDDGWVLGDGVIEGLTGHLQRAISVRSLREAAHRFPQVGLVDASALEDAEVEIGRWQHAAEQAEAKVAELQGKLDRIQGLSKDGFKVTRQQGRPPRRESAKREAVKA